MERVIETVSVPKHWYGLRCRDEECLLGVNDNGTREVWTSETAARARAIAHMALNHHVVDVLEFGESES